MDEQELLNQIQEAYQHIAGKDLTGIYVHGSIAFGCFHWERSDIDFLVVVEKPLTQRQKEQMIQVLLELDPFAPAKGFEMSVLLRSACLPLVEPIPFELHYSNAHRANYQRDLSGTCRMMQGLDPDLPAHIAVAQNVGITLCGKSIRSVFAPVSRESYLRSIWYDIKNAPEDIEAAPVYCILNLCRALAFAQEGLILSKEQGARWGLRHLPHDAAVIRAALDAYQAGAAFPSSIQLRSFAEKMLIRICQNAEFLSDCNKNN